MKDRFDRNITYMRLSVTELCNLRCRYCMPCEGLECKKQHDDMLTEEEMIMAVEAAASLGIRKLRITGGEPLVKKNIVSICEKAAKVPGIEELCLTTNGVLLDRLAKPLRDAGVSRLNISLDTFDEDKFRYITRVGNISDTLNGIKKAFEVGFDKIKINSVLIGGFNDDEVKKFADMTMDYPVDVRFIELMPMVDNSDFGPEAYMRCSDALRLLPTKLEKLAPDGGVAKLYRIPGAKGNIGFISPVSSHFCGSCNRIRITADGKIKPCLHSSLEYNIKGLDEQQMVEVMKAAILGKPEQHGELDSEHKSESGRNMNQIGG